MSCTHAQTFLHMAAFNVFPTAKGAVVFFAYTVLCVNQGEIDLHDEQLPSSCCAATFRLPAANEDSSNRFDKAESVFETKVPSPRSQ